MTPELSHTAQMHASFEQAKHLLYSDQQIAVVQAIPEPRISPAKQRQQVERDLQQAINAEVDSATPGFNGELCVGKSEYFYEEGRDKPDVRARKIAIAKGICKACVYQPVCLENAIRDNETIGIWGGTTAEERRRMITKRNQG